MNLSASIRPTCAFEFGAKRDESVDSEGMESALEEMYRIRVWISGFSCTLN